MKVCVVYIVYFAVPFLLISVKPTHSTVYLSDHCGETITLHGDRIRSHKGELYPRDLDCQVLLKTPQPFHKINLQVDWFELADESGEDGEPERCTDYLEAYSSDGLHYESRTFSRCGARSGWSTESNGDVMLLRFVTDGDQSNTERGFSGTFTSYHPAGVSGVCFSANQFYCGVQYCIDKSLTCDCKDNCGNNEDEKYCATCTADQIYGSGLSTGAIVGIVMTVLLCIVAVAVVAYIVYRKQMNNAKSAGQQQQAQPRLRGWKDATVAPAQADRHLVTTTHPL